MQAPNETERHIILTSLLGDMAVAPDVSIPALATRTAAMVASDLVDLVDQAKYQSIERVMRSTYVKQSRVY
jgi:peroxin-6